MTAPLIVYNFTPFDRRSARGLPEPHAHVLRSADAVFKYKFLPLFCLSAVSFQSLRRDKREYLGTGFGEYLLALRHMTAIDGNVSEEIIAFYELKLHASMENLYCAEKIKLQVNRIQRGAPVVQ
jgi:hypothetical protein